jgi:SpoVK/Ycf46/Vps4 family AAA+-type ATPase
MTDPDDLKLLIRSRHPLVTIETVEEERALRVVRTACEQMGLPLFTWSVVEGLRRVLPSSGGTTAGTESPLQALAHLCMSTVTAVFAFKDLSPHLHDEKAARVLRDLTQQFSRDQRTMIMIEPAVDLPKALRRTAVRYDLRLPEDGEIEGIIRKTFTDLSRHQSVRAKLTKADLHSMVRALRGLTEKEIARSVSRAALDDNVLNAADLERMLEFKRDLFMRGGVLDYVSVDLEMSELGGLENLKRWLARRRRALSPDAKKFGLEPPRGILLLGVQGCGKSLAAKAIAADWSLPLLRLDPGSLYDKFVGESERHLRQAFKVAESMAPIILWIDEIEKAFASAAGESSDGGLSRRMFGSLLHWLQEHESPIFCVATANDISALPPELLRKGRFDEVFFVDLPGVEQRQAIFAIHLTHRKRDPADFDLAALAEAADGFSGAEIEQAVVGALYTAFAEGRRLQQEDLLNELHSTRPLSVTMAEKVAALRTWASTRCVAAC